MVIKQIFKVTVHNDDLTTLYFIAKSKLDVTFKYGEYVQDHYMKDYIDEFQDFDVEQMGYAYE